MTRRPELPTRPVIRLERVTLVRNGRTLLDGVDWAAAEGQRWVILGPNGSGKTTLLKLAGAQLLPSEGTIEILGERIGRTDMRGLRTRIAYASGALLRSLRPKLTAVEVVVTGKFGWLHPWGEDIKEADRDQARALLEDVGLGGQADTAFELLSEGERQQVLLARSLMCPAEIVLMDEPAAGLDMGAREYLLERLDEIATSELRSVLFVTHHIEEVPTRFTHAMLLREGRVLAAGPLARTLTSEAVSECFGLPLEVRLTDGRYACRLRGSGRSQAVHEHPWRRVGQPGAHERQGE